MFPKVKEEPVLWGRKNSLVTKEYKAITNPDNKHLYTITSNRYKLIKHEELISGIDELLWELPEFGHNERKLEFTKNGGKMRATYTFPEISVDVGGDKIHPQIVNYNSYDTSTGLRIDFGAFKLICSNGLTIGEKVFHYNKKHFASIDFQIIMEGLKKSLNQFSDQKELWKTWVDKKLEVNEAKELVTSLELTKKEEAELDNEVEIQSGFTMLPEDQYQWVTKWVLFNILTQFITHRVKSMQRRFGLENKLRRLF
jgi:hypothetical protein